MSLTVILRNISSFGQISADSFRNGSHKNRNSRVKISSQVAYRVYEAPPQGANEIFYFHEITNEKNRFHEFTNAHCSFSRTRDMIIHISNFYGLITVTIIYEHNDRSSMDLQHGNGLG